MRLFWYNNTKQRSGVNGKLEWRPGDAFRWEASGLFASADQAEEHVVEDLRVLRHCLRQHAAAFHVFGERRQYFAKARVFDRVAQVANAFQQRDARARDLLHVEAERNEIAAGDVAAGAESAAGFFDLTEGDEIESHAAQPQLEIDLVDGIESAACGAARFVHCLVLE